jgi:hypothetical protein
MPPESHSNVGKHHAGDRLCRIHYESIGIIFQANRYGRHETLLAFRNPQQIPEGQ